MEAHKGARESTPELKMGVNSEKQLAEQAKLPEIQVAISKSRRGVSDMHCMGAELGCSGMVNCGRPPHIHRQSILLEERFGGNPIKISRLLTELVAPS